MGPWGRNNDGKKAGFLAFVIGFLWSSVWFWQSAGFSFATVFSDKFKLHEPSDERKAQ